MEPIAQIFKNNDIKLGVVVIVDDLEKPGSTVPFLTYTGNLMEVAELSKWAFMQLRRKISERLTLDD